MMVLLYFIVLKTATKKACNYVRYMSTNTIRQTIRTTAYKMHILWQNMSRTHTHTLVHEATILYFETS